MPNADENIIYSQFTNKELFHCTNMFFSVGLSEMV